jgi:transposase
MSAILRLPRDFAGLKGRRLQAAALFEEGRSQAEVARILRVSRQSASRWFHVYKRQGAQGLEGAGRAGRRPRLSPEDRRRVEQALLRGPRAHGYATERWTLKRMAEVIEEVCGVRYHIGHVWHFLDGMGWSCQWTVRPRTRAEAVP